jgi:hypothetical protein
MELKDLILFKCSKDKRFIGKFSKAPATIFATKHSCTLWKGIYNANLKYFNVTDVTRKRIANVPIDNITGRKLIDLKNKQSSGIIFFNDGVHCIYHIRNNGVYILTSSQKSKKTVLDIDYYVSETMSGFLYYDFYSDTETLYINNLLDVINKPDHLLLKEASLLSIYKAILKEEQSGNYEIIKQHQDNYTKKYNETALCLKAFMFIHFANVIDTTKVSEENDDRSIAEKLNHKPVPKISIIKVDTTYDETLKIINPFSVSGHYRNQPIGIGRKETKMIYVDSFMKSGYTRIATKQKVFNSVTATYLPKHTPQTSLLQ